MPKLNVWKENSDTYNGFGLWRASAPGFHAASNVLVFAHVPLDQDEDVDRRGASSQPDIFIIEQN